MMSQFNSPPTRKSGGSLDVYTGLLFVALIVLAIGLFILARTNMVHGGGLITLVN